MAKKLPKRTAMEYQAIGKLMEDAYLANIPGRPGILWFSFLRGLFYGLGIFLAGTVVIGVVAWVLGLFDEVPLIGPLVQSIINSLE